MSVSRSEAATPCHRFSAPARRLLLVLVGVAGTPIILILVATLLLWFIHLWNLSPWSLGIVAITLGTASICAFGWALRSLSRRRFQFSLRTMLIATALFALLLGTVGRLFLLVFRQGRAVQHFTEQGGYITHSFPDPDRNLLTDLLGYDPFGRIPGVQLLNDAAVAALVEHPEEFGDLQEAVFSSSVTDAGLEHVAKLDRLPKLQCVTFVNSNLGTPGMKRLGEWTNLNVLMLNGCSTVTDKDLACLEGLQNLEHLWLLSESRNMTITDAGLAHLGKMRNLRSLNLIRLPITDYGLAHLRNLDRLESLCVRGTTITDAGLKHLVGLMKLKSLSVVGPNISDAGIEHLKAMTELEALSLGGPRITDAGLASLREMRKLKRLYLDGTQVTDSGLGQLKELAGLEELSLDNSNKRVTATGVDGLQKALPKLKISR